MVERRSVFSSFCKVTGDVVIRQRQPPLAVEVQVMLSTLEIVEAMVVTKFR